MMYNTANIWCDFIGLPGEVQEKTGLLAVIRAKARGLPGCCCCCCCCCSCCRCCCNSCSCCSCCCCSYVHRTNTSTAASSSRFCSSHRACSACSNVSLANSTSLSNIVKPPLTSVIVDLIFFG